MFETVIAGWNSIYEIIDEEEKYVTLSELQLEKVVFLSLVSLSL